MRPDSKELSSYFQEQVYYTIKKKEAMLELAVK
jgi:hypothetical protein